MGKNWINRRNVQSWQHILIGTIHVGTGVLYLLICKESYLCNHSSHGDSSRQFGFTPHPLLKNKGIQAVVNVVNTLAWINFSLAENTSLCLGLLTERYCGVSDPSALQKKQCCKFVTWRAIEKTLNYFIKRFKTDIILPWIIIWQHLFPNIVDKHVA